MVDHPLWQKQFEKMDELLSRSTSKVTGKRINLPCFDGVDPSNWILQAEEYFDFHETYDEQRVRLVAFDMSGEGAGWYRWMKSRRMLRHWADFKEKVMTRFAISSLDDCFEEKISSEEIVDSSHEHVTELVLPSDVVEIPLISSASTKGEEPTEGLIQEPKGILSVEQEIKDCFLEQDRLTFDPIWSTTTVAAKFDSNFVMKIVPTSSNEEIISFGVQQVLTKGISSRRRMVLKFYTLKEIYWDVCLLHLEDKVLLKRLGMIRIYIYIVISIFLVLVLSSLVELIIVINGYCGVYRPIVESEPIRGAYRVSYIISTELYSMFNQ